MKKAVLKYKTIILSDVHLGAPDCQIEKVNHFLKHTWCEKLILNGDIIDGWSLARRGGWTKKHTKFIRHVLKKLEKKDTEVIYLRGNHDDILERFLPMSFDRLHVVEDYVHQSPRGNYLVLHGDVFDTVTQNMRVLSLMGDVGYQALLRINRLYNRYRNWRGKEYYSISKAIKARVKAAVNFVSKFEEGLVALCASRNCQGIICGHIHTPADRQISGIHYLNSGDWVESGTAIVEDFDGNFEVITHREFCRRLHEAAREKSERLGEPVNDGVEKVLGVRTLAEEEWDEESDTPVLVGA